LLRDLGKQLIGDVSWIGLQLLIADKDERSHRRGKKTSLTRALATISADSWMINFDVQTPVPQILVDGSPYKVWPVSLRGELFLTWSIIGRRVPPNLSPWIQGE
jgi:hypothetical protein